ncbi:MAG: agmatinase family protein [Bacteroidales bacterium]|nr:agmatinase family protein [Bacteroidales bacterium]MDI3479645.1 agmatinase [Rikenellaceae bacterium]
MNNIDNISKYGVFGLSYDKSESSLILLSIPFELTTTFREGTLYAPHKIKDASSQIDLMNNLDSYAWQKGIYWDNSNEYFFLNISKSYRPSAKKIIDFLENNQLLNDELKNEQYIINNVCEKASNEISKLVFQILQNDKIPGVIGGEHSITYGVIDAIQNVYDDFCILQIDAHHDLRNTYLGFTYSHASVMYNILNKYDNVNKIVQIGVRDYCEAEKNLVAESDNIVTFYNFDINVQLFNGKSFHDIAKQIVDLLTDNIYISFDIDGLQPYLCPETGTPVPGGLSYEQIEYLFYLISKTNKKVIGFDLCEVSGLSEWDAIVGSRIMYLLSILALR